MSKPSPSQTSAAQTEWNVVARPPGENAWATAEFSDLDRHFAAFIERLAGGNQPWVRLAAAWVSQRRAEGDICIRLTDLAALAQIGCPLPPPLSTDGRVAHGPGRTGDSPVLPSDPPGGKAARAESDLATWRERLQATSVVGGPSATTPLVLDGDRLYLRRYFEYERALATALRRRLAAAPEAPDWSLFGDGLRRLFPTRETGGVDWQKVAVFAALRRRLCIISGGPGTGKTRTVVWLLALLLEQAGEQPLRLAITAPTGKAAARIQESIKSARATLDCSEALKARLPTDATTLHRLLGTLPGSAFFRHDATHPLAVDVVVVDEASMVDLALMAKLFDALPPAARVILLGDKDQLASVEAGAVFGDICHPCQVNTFSQSFCERYTALTGERLPPTEPEPTSNQGSAGDSPVPLTASPTQFAPADCVVQLQRNYRFSEQGAIHRLSQAVKQGDARLAVDLVRSFQESAEAVRVVPLPRPTMLKAALRERVVAEFSEALACAEPREALERFGRFRILCALRNGPHGVVHLNRLVEEALAEAGHITLQSPWYAGRPVMVTRNDYGLRLFNGDIGLLLRAPGDRTLRAYFLGADGGLRSFLPQRLPAHETVFAMTVHKSQGSEFERVLFILPDHASPVLTRELIYTGLTRASHKVELWLDEAIFQAGVANRVQRASGLREAIWATPNSANDQTE